MFKVYQLFDMFRNKLNIFFKLFAILYADDIVLLAESSGELQKRLDCFHTFILLHQISGT